LTYIQMTCFISLAATQKMSETAAALGLSLSTLSKYIDRMENELSTILFERHLSRRVLTREGELIYPNIKFIVKQYDDLRENMSGFTSFYHSSIKVAICFQQAHIMRQLTEFMRKYPKIKIEIIEASASEVCAMLDSGAADVGIVYEQIIDKKFPLSYILSINKLCAVVSQSHPLAVCDTVDLLQLKHEKFILYKDDDLMYRYLLNVCIADGFVPRVEQSRMRMSTVLINVSGGNGISLFSEETIEMQEIGGNVILKLNEAPRLTTIAICKTEFPNYTIGALIRFITNEETEQVN